MTGIPAHDGKWELVLADGGAPLVIAHGQAGSRTAHSIYVRPYMEYAAFPVSAFMEL